MPAVLGLAVLAAACQPAAGHDGRADDDGRADGHRAARHQDGQAGRHPSPRATTGRPAVTAPDVGGRVDRGTGPVVAPARVELPSIGVDTSVVGLDRRDDGTIEVPPDGRHAGWYRHGAPAGTAGPTVIGAHVDWDGEPAVFAALPHVAVGDLVTITDEHGGRHPYRVDRLEQLPKGDFPTFAVYGATPDDTLRLVTCAGPFDHVARSHRDNLIVFATATG